MRNALSWLRLRLGEPMIAGLVTGLLGVIISFAGRGLIPGRELGDPLPLALSLGQIIRGGFLYFPWRGLLFHVLFALSLGGGAALVHHLLVRPNIPLVSDSVRAARIAAVINIGVVAVTEVDAVIVGLWYLMSGLLSFFITGFAAARVTERRSQ